MSATGPPYYTDPSAMGLGVPPGGMGPGYDSLSQDVPLSAPTTGKGKKKGKGKAAAAAALTMTTTALLAPVTTTPPPKKSSAWKRKRTAPTPAILPEDDGDGATAAAVAAIEAVAAMPLPPKQRKREGKKNSLTSQPSQEENPASVSQNASVSSELERMLASEAPVLGSATGSDSFSMGADVPPPAPMAGNFLFNSSDSQQENQGPFGVGESEGDKEQKVSDVMTASTTSLISNTAIVSQSDYGGAQSDFSVSLASNGSSTTHGGFNVSATTGDSKEESGISARDGLFENESKVHEVSIKVEEPTEDIAKNANDQEEGGPAEESLRQSEIQPPVSHQEQGDHSVSNLSNLYTSEASMNASGMLDESCDSGKLTERKDENGAEAENGTSESFLAMAATTALMTETSSSTPKKRSKKNALKEDGAEATSSPSSGKKRAKAPKEPKEPKPKKTPITSK